MDGARLYIVVLCVFLLLAPAGSFAADGPASTPAGSATTPSAVSDNGALVSPPHGFLGRIEQPYRPATLPPPNVSNSDRLDSLTRAGNLYLSLQDTLALALENNLDIEILRYIPRVAEANVQRARAGGFVSLTPTSVLAGPASVGGVAPSSGLQAYQVAPSTAIGITPPTFDPMVVGSAGWAHTTAPQSNTIVSGTTALIQRQDTSSLSLQQYLQSGTQVSLGMTNSTIFTNSNRSSFSPATTSSAVFNISQHLLQGFGPAVNTRQIRIAKNYREISDLTFRAQVITTVSAIADLYWDLVSFNENVRVKRDALAASQRLLSDNRKQVEVGTMAPISVVQAEAEIASDQQALTVAETQLLQQETVLKNALTRTGVMGRGGRVILTDTIKVPDVEAIAPIQDSMAQAEASRPELSQFRIMLQTQQIAIHGTRNEMMPTLDLVAALQNNALAGDANPLFTGAVPPAFTGGYGTVLSQIFARHFPTYSVGFNLNVPIRNRAAQADYINSQLVLRQQQLGLQRMENQVRVEVQNAVIGLQQARAQYQSAVEQRILEEQTLDAEQKKLAMGVSTTYNVILVQRDLVTAQSNEVAARSSYAKARVEMDRVTGQTLYNNNISMDDAVKGKVARPPNPIPDTVPTPAPKLLPQQ
jgi:outer membrane protein